MLTACKIALMPTVPIWLPEIVSSCIFEFNNKSATEYAPWLIILFAPKFSIFSCILPAKASQINLVPFTPS